MVGATGVRGVRNIIHDYRLNMYTLLVSEYEEFVHRALEHNYI